MQNKKCVLAALVVATFAVPAVAVDGFAANVKHTRSSTAVVAPQIPLADWAMEGVQNWYGAQRGVASKRQVTKTAETGFVAPTGIQTRYGSTGDYLNEMVAESSDRWSVDRLPLRVYIGAGGSGFRDSFRGLFSSAMNEWASASNGKLRWTQVSDPSSADIAVQWQGSVTSGEPESGDTRNSFAIAGDGQRVLNHADITLVTSYNGSFFSDAEMHKICLHEIGHALGLKHSSTSGDIMFWQSNPAQVSALGPRDAATIKRLYSIAN